MNEQLIQQITKLVVEKLQTNQSATATHRHDNEPLVELFSNKPTGYRRSEETSRETPSGEVTFFKYGFRESKA